VNDALMRMLMNYEFEFCEEIFCVFSVLRGF
jgi:hypothetical protein